ncbi:MAG: NUDIX domain-containing protein [Propionibacteriaceae bacterium]
MPPPDRAVAVVIRRGLLLVVLRARQGRHYAVLPGGGIEIGESPEQAAVRELAEETSLVAVATQRLWVRADGGRRAVYVRMSEVTGEPALGGPELARSGPDNQYRLYWAGASELDELDLRPTAVIPLVRALL